MTTSRSDYFPESQPTGWLSQRNFPNENWRNHYDQRRDTKGVL